MIKVKNKYVYEVNNLENFYGMIPLDMYIGIVYFNYIEEEHSDVLINLCDLSHFLTEFLLEAVTREKIDFSKIEVNATDFYISAMPSNSKETKRILLFKHFSKKILVSQLKYFNEDGSRTEFLKMKDITKEELLSLMISTQHFCYQLIDDVIKKCNKAKKVSIIEKNDEENLCSNEQKKNKMSDFDKIG